MVGVENAVLLNSLIPSRIMLLWLILFMRIVSLEEGCRMIYFWYFNVLPPPNGVNNGKFKQWEENKEGADKEPDVNELDIVNLFIVYFSQIHVLLLILTTMSPWVDHQSQCSWWWWSVWARWRSPGLSCPAPRWGPARSSPRTSWPTGRRGCSIPARTDLTTHQAHQLFIWHRLIFSVCCRIYRPISRFSKRSTMRLLNCPSGDVR